IDARDDGHGADAVAPGNGLRGMRERLSQYGGKLEIQTRRGDGFGLRICVPGAPALMPAAVTQGVF
ncbi:MAG: sensor histidine kinase, partial [Xanthomonas perforans]|nr:sensor histidine kinase [Xanthomonas perforans]